MYIIGNFGDRENWLCYLAYSKGIGWQVIERYDVVTCLTGLPNVIVVFK